MHKKTYLRSGFLKEEKNIKESWLFPTEDEKRHKELLSDMNDLSKAYSHPLIVMNPKLQKSLLKQFDDKAVELSQVEKRIADAKKNKKRWFFEEQKLHPIFDEQGHLDNAKKHDELDKEAYGKGNHEQGQYHRRRAMDSRHDADKAKRDRASPLGVSIYGPVQEQKAYSDLNQSEINLLDGVSQYHWRAGHFYKLRGDTHMMKKHQNIST